MRGARKRLRGIVRAFGLKALPIACAIPASLPLQSSYDAQLSAVERAALSTLHLDTPFAARRAQRLSSLQRTHSETKAALGRRFFNDPAFSRRGDTACADCHVASSAFASPRVVEGRNAPTLHGAGELRFLNWDGSADGLEAQAFGPLTSSLEMASSCAHVANVLQEKYADTAPGIRGQGPLNETKACAIFLSGVAHYVETLTPPPAPIDVFAEAMRRGTLATLEPVLDENSLRGARMFVGKGQCTLCHDGPFASDGEFHNTGVPSVDQETSGRAAGRAQGVRLLAQNPYRCETCEEYSVLPRGKRSAVGAFKTPTLRQLGLTPPYMHNGLYESIEGAVAHYALAPEAGVGDSELARVSMDDADRLAMTAFLRKLTSVGGSEVR